MKKDRKNSKEKKANKRLSDSADRHELYEKSVQCAESEVDFVDEQFFKLRNRKAKKLREDFCGTGQVSTEWVKRRRDNLSVGIDCDPEVLNWGKSRHVDKLTPSQKRRISFVKGDVRDVKTTAKDVVLATNFSYWCFKERAKLRTYFESANANLIEDGALFLDCFGGHEAYRLLEDETEHDEFTYIWDQADFNPVNNNLICHIHFALPDGSRLERAFTYSWRLWTLVEIREILSEAGFGQSLVFWQGWDEDVEGGSGDFSIVEKAEPDAGWIAYIVALK